MFFLYGWGFEAEILKNKGPLSLRFSLRMVGFGREFAKILLKAGIFQSIFTIKVGSKESFDNKTRLILKTGWHTPVNP